jgi:cytochrome c peroxidase
LNSRIELISKAAGALSAGGLFVSMLVAAGFAAEPATSQSTFKWKLPPGFPPPLVPADNPMSDAKVALGCRLFFEPRLSRTGTVACATCHEPQRAFTDGRATAIGATGDRVRRGSMSLANVAYTPAYTWASNRLVTLEAQMAVPLFATHPLEMGLPATPTQLLEQLAAEERYRNAFQQSFPGATEPVTVTNVIKAIAAFERTLISGRSAFDRYTYDDERGALDAAAIRGMGLFFSERVGCAQCHFGFNFSGTVVHQRKADGTAVFANTGLYNIDGRGSYPASDTGLSDESMRPADMGKFRVPTLRNIALTAPYMHDGSLATLAEVLQHYMAGGRQEPQGSSAANPLKDKAMRHIVLDASEQQDLLAFLRSLTDEEFVNPAKRGFPCE